MRQNRMTRFYLQQKEDPHGPSISLFVGNLPTGLSQRQYEKILLDIIGKGGFHCSAKYLFTIQHFKSLCHISILLIFFFLDGGGFVFLINLKMLRFRFVFCLIFLTITFLNCIISHSGLFSDTVALHSFWIYKSPLSRQIGVYHCNNFTLLLIFDISDCHLVPLSQQTYLTAMFLTCAENKWCSFDVIYYEYGSIVLIYTNPEKTTKVFNILQEAVFDDKQLLVLLLPNIQVSCFS